MTGRAKFSRGSTAPVSLALSPTEGKGRTLIATVLALAALALAACNANQTVNPSSQQNLGEIYPNYNPYNPIQYAQSSGFYGGR